MSFYCGIDLHSRSSQVAVVDDDIQTRVNRSVRNDLGEILEVLQPFEPAPRIVVESTFNWYWLIDGLHEHGYDVTLAHSLGLSLISGSKVKTDRRDAVALARLLRIGEVPIAYIYPRQTRSLRDLIRQRTSVVALRAREYAGIRRILYQHGLHDHSRNSVVQTTADELDRIFGDPRVRLIARQEIERIRLFTGQIEILERHVEQAAAHFQGFERLRGVPGLGKALAPIVFFETGSIHRFQSARTYSSYCRVVPGAANSGGKTRRGRGSKQGNPHLKSAFTQAAVHAVRYYPRIRAHFDRQLVRHRGRARTLICNNIIAHKLAVATYHILKEGTNYDERLLFGN